MTRTSISKNTTTLQDLQILLAYCWNSEEMKGFLQEPYIESSLNAMLMNPYREKENDEEIEFIFESNSLRFLIYEVSDSSILSIHSIKSDITTHIQKAKNEYHVQSLLEENQTIATVKAQGTILPVNIDVISKREVALLPYKVDTKAIHFEFVENDLNYPIQKGEILGTLSIYENDTLLKKVPYKAEQSYFDIKHYVSISCIVLMIGIVEFRRRRKKL